MPHFITRATSLGALAAALLFASGASQAAEGASAPAAAAQPAAPDCDRACLRQALDAYLTAVFKHDPGAAPLTADHFATDNTSAVRNGEGFWKDISGYGEVQRRWFDPYNQTAAFFGLLKKNDQDTTVSVRIRVKGGKVSEAEWMTSVVGPGLGNPEVTLKHPPPDGVLPASERSSRFMLISMANDYFQSVQDHDGSWIPADSACMKNGGGTTSIPTAPRRADICHDNFGIFKNITKDLALRRFPVVDEEAGVVLGVAIFQRYPGVPRPDTLVHEYFQVVNGKITEIWTSAYNLPMGTPVTTGWESKP